MTVYVAHPVKEDLSSALVYGDLHFISTKYVFADELDGNKLPKDLIERLIKTADEFDPEHDFMLIAGDHLQIVALAAELSARWGRFSVLRFDRMAGGYVEIQIDTLEGLE